jgi:hypothetical protein
MSNEQLTQSQFIAAVRKMLEVVDMAPVRRFELEHILRCWQASSQAPPIDKSMTVRDLRTKTQL